MPRTEDELRGFYKEAHDELTRQYYSDKEGFPGGKKAFDEAHAEIWTTMDQELIAGGFMELPGPSLEDRVKALEDKVG
jgi:hypothetical protein